MPRLRFLTLLFVITLVVMLVGVVSHWSTRPSPVPATPITNPATDPRFSRVIFRQDDLLDVPVLAEALRIAMARCLVGDCKQLPRDAYENLFGEQFLLIEGTEDGTLRFDVIFSQQRKRSDSYRSWTPPRLVHDFPYSTGAGRLLEPGNWYVEYQTPALHMTFKRIDGRLVLTQAYDDVRSSGGHTLLGGDFTALTFFLPAGHAEGQEISEAVIAERLAHVRQLLDELQPQAAALAPDAAQLRGTIRLEWLTTDSGCAGNTGVDGNGRFIGIAIEALMSYSDSRFRWLLGHELGHIARPDVEPCTADMASACQVAAEAFSLKLIGEDRYRRVATIAAHEDEAKVSERIATLAAVNAKYPGK